MDANAQHHIAQSRLRPSSAKRVSGAPSSRAQHHLVFDWNSTLLDDFHIIHECMNLIMQRVGRSPITIDRFRACYEVPFELLYSNLGFANGEVDRMMNLERDVFHDFYEPRAENAPLRDGAVDLLRHAKDKGLPAYILSNHIVEPIRAQLRRLEIEPYFAEVLAYATRAEQFRDMTKGERLRRFMAERGIEAGRTMIVGDSVEEIQIARAEGLTSVAITGGGALEERLRSEKPDYVIHALRELKPILQERGFVS
jgi:phosphoglycolate phosphatase